MFLLTADFAPKLILYDRDTGHKYAEYAMEEGGSFSVTFVHSVNKSPVSDVYEIRDGKIFLTGTVYYGFGAGVPTDLSPGQTLSYGANGEMIIDGMDTEMKDLIYIVGTVYDHILHVNGEEINLTELCGKNSAVAFVCKLRPF